jgi:aminopeptidase N
MRIFVRNSKKAYVEADLIFRVVTQGMKYYGELFDCPFPFDKYDIIYCPEFRITAMENVGAITFTDRILMPADELDDVVKTIHYHVHLHELAHMWFGDLTTMVWWNDLWLKESFADFLCGISFAEAVYTEDPKIFDSVDQVWNQYYSLAIEADLKPSTHPISVEIKHTGEAAATFDEISYRKGATWLKTMDYFIGRPVLKKACQLYVKEFGYKNAVLDDMIDCFQRAIKSEDPDSKLNLAEWTDSWLKKQGPNNIECSIGQVGLEIKQSFPKHADH